jgi:hypothetical protein
VVRVRLFGVTVTTATSGGGGMAAPCAGASDFFSPQPASANNTDKTIAVMRMEQLAGLVKISHSKSEVNRPFGRFRKKRKSRSHTALTGGRTWLWLIYMGK